MADIAFDSIKAEHLADGSLFEDDEFPAGESSLSFSAKPSWSGIEWKRPKEFCDDPQFMLEGSSRFDLSQGLLGNCWFISASATLATRPKLLNKVCPKNQTFAEGEYAGIFRFNFWRFGAWMETIVDDRLPTKDGKLVFCSNREHGNELWAALMEKAYAKLHGSYQALENGYSHDALVDFTGGIGEFIDLKKDYENRGRLFKVLRRSLRMGSMMCAAIDVLEGGSYEDKLENGLVTGHAYSITNVVQLEADGIKYKIVRLRNPWGYREWNGAWSDGSAEWEKVSQEDKDKFDLKTADDGEFWMPYEDFLTSFHTVQICHLGPESVLDKKGSKQWHTWSYHSAWIRGVTAGGCGSPPNQDIYWMNPQYAIRLSVTDEAGDDEDTCTLVVSLIQKYRRQLKTLNKSEEGFEEAIGFDILRFKNDEVVELGEAHYQPDDLRMERKMHRYELLRERSGRFSLLPGAYCIIPCVFTKDTEAEFLLRLATEQPAESEEIGSSTTESPPKRKKRDVPGAAKFNELFNKYAGADGELDARELKQMLNSGLKRENDEEFEKESARSLIVSILGKRGKLDKTQARNAWREAKRLRNVFNEFDKDENRVLDKKEMRKAFRSLGYNLTKKTLVAISQNFCGKGESITLDDFLLLASKLSVQFDKYKRLTSKDEIKVNMTLDEWLESTILN